MATPLVAQISARSVFHTSDKTGIRKTKYERMHYPPPGLLPRPAPGQQAWESFSD